MLQTFKKRVATSYNALDNIFSDKEAWLLFRIAAILETIGWILLVTGIIFTIKQLPQHETVLALSGSIHGIFYIFYIFIIIFAHRSLKWGVWRFLISGAVSTFPFGALLFEKWEARRRKRLFSR
jgi:integral membrane protein